MTQPDTRSKNPLFLVLAVLSGVPAVFFGFVFIQGGQSAITGAIFLWSWMWAYVWWRMADRYR